MRDASLTLCQCIWKSIWLRVELLCDIYIVYCPLLSVSCFYLSSPFPSVSPRLYPSFYTALSLHVLLLKQLPVHKVNLSLLRNSTLIFEIDKHFCVLQLGVPLGWEGRWLGARGIRSKVAHFRLPFFSALLLLLLLPPRFPISSRNHLFLLLYCEGSGRVMGRRDGERSGGFAFLALRLAVALPSPSPSSSPCSVLIEDLYWLRFYVRINGQWDKARERRGGGVYVCLFVCTYLCVCLWVCCAIYANVARVLKLVR